MSQYYLVSQLPSLDGIADGAPLPISEERFLELCRRFLGKRALVCLEGLTLTPPREHTYTGSALIDAWNEGERSLRLALALARAAKQKKMFDAGGEPVSAALMQTARTALECSDPLEAELFLHKYRLDCLESLRPMDAFSDDAVFYYGLRLMLLSRIRRQDKASGEAAYRNIYSSIMNGEGREVVQ